jgi:NAD(P) transhydrogenase subunit alpha
MYVNVAILKETQTHERRVALVPSVIPKLIKLGAKLHMQTGAGNGIKLTDAAYKEVEFFENRHELVKQADVVLGVNAPSLDVINAMKEGAILIAFVYEHKDPALVRRLLERKITCFAMERVPRITRAQSMDALSSQSALAGYYAVPLGATALARILPKITTAAGAIGPAHRMGAVVEGYDVRAETQEQVESLGATFVSTGVDATGTGGYARELTPEEKAKVTAVLTQHIQQSDLVITTAAIPGEASPKLISHVQVAGMKAGAVIVDLSAEGGGNCEDSEPGQTVRVGPVTILAPLNVPSLLGEDASELYARNQYHLLELFMRDNVVSIDWTDEILAKTCLTHAGKLTKDAPKPDQGAGAAKTTPPAKAAQPPAKAARRRQLRRFR